jgi:hypothetical protein
MNVFGKNLLSIIKTHFELHSIFRSDFEVERVNLSGSAATSTTQGATTPRRPNRPSF